MHKLTAICLAILLATAATAQSFTINGPAGSGWFGSDIILLSNGNFVVTDPDYDEGATMNVGAVYLYSGTSFTPISVLKGSTAEDRVGNVIPLPNGNFLVVTTSWDNGAAINAGAVTLVNGISGLSGVVSPANSLVGSNSNDRVGGNGFNSKIIVLPNGNFVVLSTSWDNGSTANVGAVTWGNGSTGITGPVSAGNSLVGTRAEDAVGNGSINVLTNNNYLIHSPDWDNTWAVNAGAVTWCNGSTGIAGVLSSSNSLVGAITGDRMGGDGFFKEIYPLTNGNYVVGCGKCDIGGNANTGAVIWGNGTTGISGPVSASISLTGTFNDFIGFGGVTALTNGNYVVRSTAWPNNSGRGAATWGNGNIGTTGLVSSSNSLVGSASFDVVGGSVTALSNGNYVVASSQWDNGALADVGAVTWCNGSTGTSGIVSSSNSLVGSVLNDAIGSEGIVALSNGNYVVASSNCDINGIADAGAVTLIDGSVGITGTISSSNSLVGGIANNNVGSGKVTALPNGNYVVGSPNWDNGTPANIGAITWVNGTTGIIGLVSASNSLTGTTANDNVGGANTIKVLANGNYIVTSINWDNGAFSNAGAVTWGNGATGLSGAVSSSNSLVGSKANDVVGKQGITILSNGNYLISSAEWDNGVIVNASAITWAGGTTGVSGPITSANSLIGATASDFIGGDINGGGGNIISFSNGNYAITSGFWDNGATVNAGATTWGNASVPLTGVINSCNSIIGGDNTTPVIHMADQNLMIAGFATANKFVIYNPSGMSLANSLDTRTTSIAGSKPIAIIAESNCRIIASVTPNGGSPVTGNVTAETWIESSVPTHAGQPFVARHYQIMPAINAAAATARVTLYFNQQEFTDFNNHSGSILNLPTGTADATGKSNLRIGKYSGTSNNGSGLPASYSSAASVINPDDNDIVWNLMYDRWEVSFNVTGFSGFIVQTAVNVLPLTLLEFNGRLANNNGLLNWKTTDEQKTSSFDIERSTDGRNYTAVGNLAAFNTGGIHQYNYTDNNITSLGVPVVYYRLKQKDIDGRFTYSRIVALSLDNSRNMILLYPNPVINEANLTVTTNKKQQLQVNVIDNAGRIVKQQQWNVTAGSSSLSVNISSLAKGMYYLELKGETINERRQFVKQ